MAALRLPLALAPYTRYPILAGPWRSELGFEVLYWVPYLRRWMRQHKIGGTRVVPITRGGMGAWYGVPRGLELYAMREPLEVWREQRRQQIATRGRPDAPGGSLKQLTETSWDQAVLADAVSTLDAHAYHVLAPSVMYRQYVSTWQGRQGLLGLLARGDYRQDGWASPGMAPYPDLPKRYVAVRWYDRYTFGLDEGMVAWVRRLTDAMATRIPVVSIELADQVDDHQDLPLRGPNITPVTLTDPQTSLWDCGRILRHAQAFVGSYGAVAQWAVMLGTPSVSYYTKWGGTADAHLAWSQFLARQWQVPYRVEHISSAARLGIAGAVDGRVA